LLLGGVVTTRLRPPSVLEEMAHEGRHFLARPLVVVGSLFVPVMAELMAPDAVMSGGQVDEGITWLVVGAVGFGVWAVGLVGWRSALRS
jgi:hypothetical protein